LPFRQHMKYFFIFLISQSILLPLIAGLIRFHRIGKSYQPFLLLLSIGFIVEIVSFILMVNFAETGNAVPVNIYTLIEWTLLAWQFHVWGFLRQKKKTFYVLLGLGTLIWIIVNIVFGKINEFSPYFRFFYYFVVVLLSVNEINFMITHYNKNLFRNPRFLICIGLIFYFVYMIVDYWAFEISKLGKPEISITLAAWGSYVNVIANIIYTIAFLLIPAPQKFTLE
jgi:hypothetical protein